MSIESVLSIFIAVVVFLLVGMLGSFLYSTLGWIAVFPMMAFIAFIIYTLVNEHNFH